MPTLKSIIAVIEALAPVSLAEDWDNCGLQIGEPGCEVKKVLVALDPLPEVMEEAARAGASLVVSHHPLFFDAVRSLDTSSGTGAAVKAAIMGGVAVYSAHTSLDSTKPGVSDALAGILKLKDTRPILRAGGQDAGLGLGRVGRLPKPMKVRDIAAVLKDALGCESARLTGEPERRVSRVAVCGGSGSELIYDVLRSGAEVFVTGDVKYHWALKARECGLALIDVGHFESEAYALASFAAGLRKALKKKGQEVDVEVSHVRKLPWRTL